MHWQVPAVEEGRDFSMKEYLRGKKTTLGGGFRGYYKLMKNVKKMRRHTLNTIKYYIYTSSLRKDRVLFNYIEVSRRFLQLIDIQIFKFLTRMPIFISPQCTHDAKIQYTASEDAVS